MRKWLIGIGVVLVALGALVWWALIDAAAPARAEGEFQLDAYRALVENDAPDTLPTEVRVEFVGQSNVPSFATEAGAFGGQRTLTYTAFSIVAPGGDTIIDAAVDETTLDEMSNNEGSFDAASYGRVLDAMTRALNIVFTHEHLDHVMAVARHPQPETIAERVRITQPQLDALPQHAPNGVLPASLSGLSPLDLEAPQRIAPGVVAHAAPGHSAGSVVIYARTAAREYVFIGDIAWVMSSIENLRGRPRLIGAVIPGVDPDRPRVLRQLRALHDMGAANPSLVIVPAHDSAYLNGLVASGALIQGFAPATPEAPGAPSPE